MSSAKDNDVITTPTFVLLSLLMSEMSLCRVDKGSIIHLEASSHGGRQDNV